MELKSRPALVPVVIEWSEELLRRNEDAVRFEIVGVNTSLVDAGLELRDHTDSGPIRFRVFTDGSSAEYEIVFTGKGVEYRPIGAASANIILAKETRPLSDWLHDYPPTVRFADNSFPVFNEHFRLGLADMVPFDLERIEAWDWTGVTIAKESQGLARDSDSIQFRVIQKMKQQNYEILFDDDALNEAADVVGLLTDGERLIIDLFHLKYSSKPPGARVDDLYEVCGQAQRSAVWKEDAERLVEHLVARESLRMKKTGVSRFEVGDLKQLSTLRRKIRFLMPEVRITVVQPGLSKAKISGDQLELLAATETYLQATYGISLRVVASD